MSLGGRVALVTGASGGIGRALAQRLAGAGATVALHYGSRAEPVEELAQALIAAGARTAVFAADLGEAEAPERLAEDVARELGPIEVLAANAGRGGRPVALEDVDAEAFDAMLAVNLRAPFLLARAVLPGMRERGFGRILFTSSVAALTGGVVGPHYAASKAGLHAITHFIAARTAREGITVNAIAPALIEDTAMLPGDPGDLAARIPVGRLGRPEEVASLALAMLENAYLTSKVVVLDGGLRPG